MVRWLSFCFIFGVALAGCGGSGSSGTLVPQSPASGAPSTLSVAVSISIPAPPTLGSASARRPQYASVNTRSASVAVDSGKPVIANLSGGSQGCTSLAGGGRTCIIAVTASPGKHSFTVILFASTDGSGAPLSQNTTSATITAGIANTVTMTLGGIVSSIVVGLATPNPPAGTAATIGLTVTFKDASGASIIGSDAFVNPVTLTASDTSVVSSISKTTLASPADAAALTVNYTGKSAQATLGATAAGVAATSTIAAILAPQAATTPTSLVDWPTYGYDTQRSGYNPNTTPITPASISNLHIAWQTAINGSTQSQPIVATNIAGHAALLIVANFAIAQAYDALTGKIVWAHELPTQDLQDCGLGAISGTAQYDKALGAVFMAAGNGAGAPNHVILYKLDVATGNVIGSVDVTPTLLPGEGAYSHTGVTLANGRIYLGTGSDCEGTPGGKFPSWRGRVVSVDPSSMQLLSTFYPTWQQGGNYGGGGVWAWGGVSSDASGNVFVSTGNGETVGSVKPQTIAAPFVAMPDEFLGFADHLVELSSDLGTVTNSNYPGFNFTIGHGDLDYTGVPVVAEASAALGCSEFTATMGKGGELVTNNTQNLGVTQTFALSVPTSDGDFIGNPGYSPTTGYVYSPIPTSGPGSAMYPPGLAAIGNCGSSIAWTAQFGPDSAAYRGTARSGPTVTAGGVVFVGTPCTNDGKGGCGAPGVRNGALWAVDAAKGIVLGGGKPLVITADKIRMAPSADGSWLWLLDSSGNLYGLTVDPSIRAVASKPGLRVTSRLRIKEGN